MSVKTVILALLRNGPLHGYELKRIIETDMGDWTDIAFGSIYFALDQLRKEGFVISHTEDGEAHRPSRIVYTVTETGKTEYLRLLREIWTDRTQRRNAIDIGVAFMRDLPPDEVRGYLRGRIAGISEALGYLDAHERETRKDPDIPDSSALIFSHARHQMRAEIAWAQEVLDTLDDRILNGSD